MKIRRFWTKLRVSKREGGILALTLGLFLIVLLVLYFPAEQSIDGEFSCLRLSADGAKTDAVQVELTGTLKNRLLGADTFDGSFYLTDETGERRGGTLERAAVSKLGDGRTLYILYEVELPANSVPDSAEDAQYDGSVCAYFQCEPADSSAVNRAGLDGTTAMMPSSGCSGSGVLSYDAEARRMVCYAFVCQLDLVYTGGEMKFTLEQICFTSDESEISVDCGNLSITWTAENQAEEVLFRSETTLCAVTPLGLYLTTTEKYDPEQFDVLRGLGNLLTVHTGDTALSGSSLRNKGEGIGGTQSSFCGRPPLGTLFSPGEITEVEFDGVSLEPPTAEQTDEASSAE